jgi:hypothetical protein
VTFKNPDQTGVIKGEAHPGTEVTTSSEAS